MTVHVKSEKEPRVFRGDSSDKYTIQEWVDMSTDYLKRQRCDVPDQAEEIMSRLMGKARDAVKIDLWGEESLDVKQNPDLIYHILLQYFSDTSSCLPLEDFYSTKPKLREDSVDNWTRLNKAADLANEGLRRQGGRMENISQQVACIFVEHCPDPELSCRFNCKALEWNSRDVQVRINEYQREQRALMKQRSVSQLKSHATALHEGPNVTQQS